MEGYLLLAAIHYDRGNTLAAQYWVLPLLNPSVPEDIRLAAQQLKERILKAHAASMPHRRTWKTTRKRRNSRPKLRRKNQRPRLQTKTL